MAGPNFREENGKEKKFDPKKFVQEWIEYKKSEAWWEKFKSSDEYRRYHSEIMKTLDNPSKLEKSLKNLQNKKPIIPIIFGSEVDEYAHTQEELERKEGVVRAILANDLTIEPGMRKELVVLQKEIAILLAGDENWIVKLGIALNTDIMPDVFAEVAEKLKNEEDWRVVFGLLLNPNTPEEIANEIEKKYKIFLDVYEAFEERESSSKQLLEEQLEEQFKSLIELIMQQLEEFESLIKLIKQLLRN